MSGKKKLERATRHNRVVALPSKKVERPLTDENGHVVLGKDGQAQTETVQLYKIKKLS
jgi:hypothetical protein